MHSPEHASDSSQGWGDASDGWAPPTPAGDDGRSTDEQQRPYAGWSPAAPPPPAPKPGVVALRPLGFGEILDGAFTTIQRYPAILLGLSAVLFAIFAGLEALIAQRLGIYAVVAWLETTQEITDQQVLNAAGQVLIFAGAVLFLQWLIASLLTGMITVTTARGVLGAPVTLRTAWATCKGRLLHLFGLILTIWAVMLGITVGGTIAMVFLSVVVGGIGALVVLAAGLPAMAFLLLFLAIRWTVAASALILETRVRPDGARRGIGIGAALGRSWHLIKGRSWRTFAIVIVAFLIASVVSTILQYAFTLLGTAVADLLGDTSAASVGLIGGIGYVGGGVLQVAFIAAVNVLVYTDARMRREGLDIELAAATAARNAADQPGALDPTSRPALHGDLDRAAAETREATLAPWTVT